MPSEHLQPRKTACLVLMLKAPSRSKRRLAEQVGALAEVAATHLCDCALEDAAAWPGPVCYAPAEQRDAVWFRGRLGAGAQLLVQRGGNLGARINDLDTRLTGKGYRQRIYIGMDCPQLDLAYLLEAQRALEHHDAVLGPAADGGVVLMATRRPWPELRRLPWSTSMLCDDLRRACTSAGWTVANMDERSDVDGIDDLLAAHQALACDSRPARRALRLWLSGQGDHLRQHR